MNRRDDSITATLDVAPTVWLEEKVKSKHGTGTPSQPGHLVSWGGLPSDIGLRVPSPGYVFFSLLVGEMALIIMGLSKMSLEDYARNLLCSGLMSILRDEPQGCHIQLRARITT